MAIATTSGLGTRLCEVFGLDNKSVSEITIKVRAGSVVTADVRMFVRDDAGEKIGEVLKHYELTEKNDAPTEAVVRQDENGKLIVKEAQR